MNDRLGENFLVAGIEAKFLKRKSRVDVLAVDGGHEIADFDRAELSDQCLLAMYLFPEPSQTSTKPLRSASKARVSR